MIRSFSIYGAPSDRRYAAIWHPNPTYVKSHVHPADSASDYQTNFNAEIQLPGVYLNAYRPAYVALSSDATYCSVFKDDFVGPWVARHGLSGSDYQTFFNQQVAEGNYPIVVQGGGTTPRRSTPQSSPSRTFPTRASGRPPGRRSPPSCPSIRQCRSSCSPTACALRSSPSPRTAQ